MKKNGSVYVTDAQMRNSLAVIRSLGKRGIDVTAGEETAFATGFFSRHCAHRQVYPSPCKRPGEFVEHMLKEAKTGRYDVLLPVTDATVIPIVKRKDEFSGYVSIPYPDYETLFKASDKISTLKIALANSIPCPRTYYMGDAAGGDLKRLSETLEYPVVIKPSRGFGSMGVLLCESKEQLSGMCGKIDARYGPFLVQEYVPNGGEIGVCTLFDKGSMPIALTVHRRIRSYPAKGGPSTLRETVKNEQAVSIAFKLLSAMKWQGIAMVEFRIDPRDGAPKLMEVNPRFWGSLNLSVLAGVDFPHLLYRTAMGESMRQDLSYKVGVRSRWLLPGDILWYLTGPGKLRNLSSFLACSAADDIISLSDPGPTLGFMAAAARYAFDGEMWNFILKKT